MNTKAVIIGYLVLDEGRPVRRFSMRDESANYYPGALRSNTPISIFTSYNRARRVKRWLQRRHRAQANCFDPTASTDQKRCFELWNHRAASIHVRWVVSNYLEGLR